MEVYFTRLPIFDQKQDVYGYDLLFKSQFEKIYDNTGWEASNHTALVLSFLSSNLTMLTRGRRAFIEFSRNMLMEEVFSLFPSHHLTVTLRQVDSYNHFLKEVCINLHQSGGQVSLEIDDPKNMNPELLSHAKILQMDFRQVEKEESFQAFIADMKERKIDLLARNVDSQEDFKAAMNMGFTHFEGDFYKRGALVQKGEDSLQFSKSNHFRLLQEINHPEVEFERLSNIIKRDVSLSYKLLRYINSAFFGFQNEIKSIKYALVLLGLMHIKKWLSKITMLQLGSDKPEELIMASIIRARFCELLGPKVGLKARETELFLMGLFSMLDAFLDRPLNQIFEELPLSEDIVNTLTGKPSPFQDLYKVVLSYEQGDWETFSQNARELELDETEVPLLFLKSIEWSNQVFFD